MKPLLIFIALSVLMLAGPPSSSAPTSRPERPYHRLIGGGVGEWEQLLTANAALGGGYDDNVLAAANDGLVRGGSRNPQMQRRGTLGQFSGGLNYSVSRESLSLGGSLSTSATYFPKAT